MAENSPYRSSSDLVLLVLTRTGVLSAGNAVDVEDFATVNNELDSIYRKLGGLEIVYISDPDNIPGAWFSDLADLVGGECASSLGIVGEEYVQLVNKGLGGANNVPIGAGAAAMSLKIMTRGKPTYEVQRMQNF